jgi:hypothetical protein
MIRLLLAALLSSYPHIKYRTRIERRFDAIATAALDASETHGVPPALVVSVGFLESQFGADPRSGGSWGAPRDRRHRHVAGGPNEQASALALGYRACGSWDRALHFFRCGLCRCPRVVGYTPDAAMRLAERIYARAGIAMEGR